MSHFVSLYREVDSTWPSLDNPVLVHCGYVHATVMYVVQCVHLIRAGVGRTALFIALRIAVEQAHAERTVDLVSIVNKMRQQRMKMIQTEVYSYFYQMLTLSLVQEQYIFLHNAVLEWEYCGKTSVTPMDMMRITRTFEVINPVLKMSSYNAQFKVQLSTRQPHM